MPVCVASVRLVRVLAGLAYSFRPYENEYTIRELDKYLCKAGLTFEDMFRCLDVTYNGSISISQFQCLF